MTFEKPVYSIPLFATPHGTIIKAGIHFLEDISESGMERLKQYEKHVIDDGEELYGGYLTKDDIAIAAWNDPDLLRQCRVNAYAKKVIDKNNENLNVPYGLAEVSFQVHGISGFKRGDYLEYVGLPKNFTVDSIFQVHEISHEISSGGWFTNIVTKMRPYKKNKR